MSKHPEPWQPVRMHQPAARPLPEQHFRLAQGQRIIVDGRVGLGGKIKLLLAESHEIRRLIGSPDQPEKGEE